MRVIRPAPVAHLASIAVMLLVTNFRAFAVEATALPMLTRTAWGASPALPGMKPHQPYSIIVHHTGAKQNTRLGLTEKLRGLQNFSQSSRKMADGRTLPSWPDLPYHYYISVDGTVGEGRDVNFAGDTNTKYDTTGHVQVVLEGNFEVEQPTAAQIAALKKVLLWQAARWRVPISKISMHRDHAQTLCPGKNLIAILPQVLAELQQQSR